MEKQDKQEGVLLTDVGEGHKVRWQVWDGQAWQEVPGMDKELDNA